VLLRHACEYRAKLAGGRLPVGATFAGDEQIRSFECGGQTNRFGNQPGAGQDFGGTKSAQAVAQSSGGTVARRTFRARDVPKVGKSLRLNLYTFQLDRFGQ